MFQSNILRQELFEVSSFCNIILMINVLFTKFGLPSTSYDFRYCVLLAIFYCTTIHIKHLFAYFLLKMYYD